MKEINTVVFDIGNVLVKFDWVAYLKSCGYEEKIIRKVGNATVNHKIWREWDRGVITEEEMIEQCGKHDPSVKDEIRRFFIEYRKLVDKCDYAADLVKNLKTNGYKVYLLSNFSQYHYEGDKEFFEFLPYVDGAVISYEIKYVKPEPEIYEELIKRYGINPEQTVFLDDLQVNLDGAILFGFHTIQVKSYEQMLEELRKLGVRI